MMNTRPKAGLPTLESLGPGAENTVQPFTLTRI
jgi:hypothetical protein